MSCSCIVTRHIDADVRHSTTDDRRQPTLVAVAIWREQQPQITDVQITAAEPCEAATYSV